MGILLAAVWLLLSVFIFVLLHSLIGDVAYLFMFLFGLLGGYMIRGR